MSAKVFHERANGLQGGQEIMRPLRESLSATKHFRASRSNISPKRNKTYLKGLNVQLIKPEKGNSIWVNKR